LQVSTNSGCSMYLTPSSKHVLLTCRTSIGDWLKESVSVSVNAYGANADR
jgi:hypothetical protein